MVASVPAGHVYVRHLAPEEAPGPHRLPDPLPCGAVAPTERWWPPVMLDPAWAARADFDVFHLHFGFDARAPTELAALVQTLRHRGKPFVYTVHDLRNPHHDDREAHDRQLDVLVPAADRLITLTDGAAAEIRRRWGREAVVVPHPHVVPLATMRAAASMREVRGRGCGGDRRFRVGVHVKSLRASMAPLRLLPTLVETIGDLPGGVLQVNAHHDVMDPAGPRYDRPLAEALRRYAEQGALELQVHDFLPDHDLWCYLASLDVSVLPYRFGTHSGWLEACRDLGTTVVAPTCGYFADQGPVLQYGHDEDSVDLDSLAAALRRAHGERPSLGASSEQRRRQRRAVATAHDRVYRTVLER